MNEDSVFPQHVDAEGARSYLVCDGVGGNNRGEIASDIVCRSIGNILSHTEFVGEETIRSAVSAAEHNLSAHSEIYPECKGMASTVVGLHPLEDGSAYAYWVGDSRLYHVRNGKVIFKTRDHSLVQLMVDNGQITPEEAQQSHRKNIILQAISDGNRFTTPEIVHLTDVRSEDIFLLMSDGILEGCPECDIIETIRQTDLKSGVRIIRERCENTSKDNFTLIALQVQ